jgi:hypothetical protein
MLSSVKRSTILYAVVAMVWMGLTEWLSNCILVADDLTRRARERFGS